MIEANPKLVKSYSAIDLEAIRHKFYDAISKADQILLDAYLEYLELIGMKPDEARYYANEVDIRQEFGVCAKKFEEIDSFLYNLMAPDEYFVPVSDLEPVSDLKPVSDVVS